jgi:hypothetical protein
MGEFFYKFYFAGVWVTAGGTVAWPEPFIIPELWYITGQPWFW